MIQKKMILKINFFLQCFELNQKYKNYAIFYPLEVLVYVQLDAIGLTLSPGIVVFTGFGIRKSHNEHLVCIIVSSCCFYSHGRRRSL